MKQGEVPEIFLTSQKTRFEALMRSTLFPGLGQFYSERNSWGWVWLSSGVAAGIYFYQIQTRDFVKTKKMVLLK